MRKRISAVVLLGVLLIVSGGVLAWYEYDVNNQGVWSLSLAIGESQIDAGVRNNTETHKDVNSIIWFGPVDRPYNDAQAISQARVRTLSLVKNLSVYGVEPVLQEALGAFNMGVATIPAENIQKVANHPDVKAVSLNHFISIPTQSVFESFPSTEDVVRQLSIDNLPPADNIDIAILDSGSSPIVDYELELSAMEGRKTETSPVDSFGHGAVVGQIVDAVAPNANLISIKTLGYDGTARTSTILRAMEMTVELDEPYKVEVVNMSLGGPASIFDPMELAAETMAREYGIHVIAAAGNTGGPMTSPATGDLVVSVGALTEDLEPADYSARNPTIWAVGNHRVLWGGETPMDGKGTSYASPVVAGAFARYLSGRTNISRIDAVTTLKQDVFQASGGLRVLDGNSLSQTTPFERESTSQAMLPYLLIGIVGVALVGYGGYKRG